MARHSVTGRVVRDPVVAAEREVEITGSTLLTIWTCTVRPAPGSPLHEPNQRTVRADSVRCRRSVHYRVSDHRLLRSGSSDRLPTPAADRSSQASRPAPRRAPRTWRPSRVRSSEAPRLWPAAVDDRSARQATPRGHQQPGWPRCGQGAQADAHAGSPRTPRHPRRAEPRARYRSRAERGSPPRPVHRSAPRRGRKRQRPASGHGPRCSSRAASTSSRPTDPALRRVRLSHSSTVGRAARRVASPRRSSGMLTPASAARRARPAYTSSSRSRI